MENNSLHKLGIDIGSTTVKLLYWMKKTIFFSLITSAISLTSRRH